MLHPFLEQFPLLSVFWYTIQPDYWGGQAPPCCITGGPLAPLAPQVPTTRGRPLCFLLTVGCSMNVSFSTHIYPWKLWQIHVTTCSMWYTGEWTSVIAWIIEPPCSIIHGNSLSCTDSQYTNLQLHDTNCLHSVSDSLSKPPETCLLLDSLPSAL